MSRPTRFEEHRWLGDKRTQLAYDLDRYSDDDVISEIVEAGAAASFAPDSLPEARNRGYRLAPGHPHT
jgi:hypothetical protein